MERLQVEDAQIEYEVQGAGEPVLLIPLGLIMDGLGRPLFAQPALAAKHQLIHYHRRGYGESTLGQGPPSIARQAGDAATLLRHLGVSRAHVAGHSIGGLIALQLAVDAPPLVQSLALLEPPPLMVPGGQAQAGQALLPAIMAYRAGNQRAAVDLFAAAVFGPGWQAIVEHTLPGAVEQAVRDADTFFHGDLPAIQEWQFGPEQATPIRQPVLSVLGARSTQPQAVQAVRELLRSWFAQLETCDVQATHLLQLQDPPGVARCLAAFFARHPII